MELAEFLLTFLSPFLPTALPDCSLVEFLSSLCSYCTRDSLIITLHYGCVAGWGGALLG